MSLAGMIFNVSWYCDVPPWRQAQLLPNWTIQTANQTTDEREARLSEQLEIAAGTTGSETTLAELFSITKLLTGVKTWSNSRISPVPVSGLAFLRVLKLRRLLPLCLMQISQASPPYHR
jgi:hypothetical protein